MRFKALRKKYSSYSALLLLFSCGGTEVRQSTTDTPYITSGVEQFFLPELPAWANYSAVGRCYKSSSFQYLDFPRLSASYQLNYAEMVELQGQYNERRENYFRTTTYRFLKPVEESAYFSNTLEQVRGGVKLFKLPPASHVEFIWLEGFTQLNKLPELKKLSESGRFDERPPVLFSSCFSRQRLQQWISENGLEDAGFSLLSAEWLSPYNSSNVLSGGLGLEVQKLLNPGVKAHFVVPDKTPLPLELIF